MIAYEHVERNGKTYVHAYSTEGLPIRRVGTDRTYKDAVDPLNSNRYYQEVTDEPIEENLPVEPPTEEEQEMQKKYVLTEEQYNNLLQRITIAENQTSMKITEVEELKEAIDMLLGLEV